MALHVLYASAQYDELLEVVQIAKRLSQIANAEGLQVNSCGLRPIEYAALVNNVEAIYILLHARPWILAAPDWRFADIFSVEVKQRIDLHIRKLKQNADDSWAERDYSTAIALYTEAMVYIPRDEKLLANRGLCWVCMGEASFALQDAMGCVHLKPDWAKAHLREAAAWHLQWIIQSNPSISDDESKGTQVLIPIAWGLITLFAEKDVRIFTQIICLKDDFLDTFLFVFAGTQR
ncbi:hypothetical protein ACS0TY_021670 [Phlomoides rotata]